MVVKAKGKLECHEDLFKATRVLKRFYRRDILVSGFEYDICFVSWGCGG